MLEINGEIVSMPDHLVLVVHRDVGASRIRTPVLLPQ